MSDFLQKCELLGMMRLWILFKSSVLARLLWHHSVELSRVMPHYTVEVEVQIPLSASVYWVLMKWVLRSIDEMSIDEKILIVAGWGWKFKLITRPSLIPTLLRKARVPHYCSQVTSIISTPWQSVGWKWLLYLQVVVKFLSLHQATSVTTPSEKGCGILVPFVIVEVQAPLMDSINTMQGCRGKGCVIPQWKWKSWLPSQPLLTQNRELWHFVTNRWGWQSSLPTWAIV